MTGASAGIGLALVKQLLQRGHVAFLCSRDQQRGVAARDSLCLSESEASRCHLVLLDTMSDESCATAAGRVSELLGAGRTLDALVNNAGVGLQTSVGADAVLETNLRGCKRVFDTFLPLLRPDGGRVVNLGSGARLRHSGRGISAPRSQN